MKHTAVMAGLGVMGKNTLLMNKRYGNLLTLGAILTTLGLQSDTFYENICPESCNQCLKSCPVGAIQNGSVDQKLCRPHTYGQTARGFGTVECNKCRTVCPINN